MTQSNTAQATLRSLLKSPRLHVINSLTLVLVVLLGACSSNESASTNGDATGGDTTGGDTTGGDTSGSTTASPLGPFPRPPLSAAPSQDDEPVAEAGNLNTVNDLVLVRDPGARIIEPIRNTLTDADFDAGPPPGVLNIPNGVNPQINSAPEFENLMNIDAIAGEILEIVFKPVDADGELPGMFPVSLAPGASFVDNFDGSKTYRWQPLEKDVGINTFAVTAIDFSNNQYTNTRTILIRVQLPDELSIIPNLAPSLEALELHTVRQNDPVVLELKGIDLNGTVPTLELASDLPEASFVQHPRFEEVYSLRFVPTVIGDMSIDIIARDAVNSSLTSTNTITLKVQPASAFERSDERLRKLASARGIQFGYASLQEFYHRPDGALYADIAASEFDLVTPENAMKMNVINPEPGRYQFADIDNLMRFAERHDMSVHGHPVLWYKQLPDWIRNVPQKDLEGHMREYIWRLMIRYHDDVDIWDVVNEPIGDNGGYRDSIWYRAMGEQYLDTAFFQARSADPDGILLLNDYDIAINGAKADTLFNILNALQERKVPIDGVGFQLHVFSDFNQFDEVRANFQKVADLGLAVYITELDVGLRDNNDLQAQANVYQQIVGLCLEQSRCKAVQTWGFTDQYSFRENFSPLMFDKNYQPKPAYLAIQNILGN